ncbi:MAG: N-6 DNA methylase [Elusimicrobiales bacterium]|nr:N-6 DNA methylase [Elusimicrobiales bacterium]
MRELFRDYLSEVESAYKAGNATEHTHRPALKKLLEAFAEGITATNEPRRIKCGAPDYIITRGGIPAGFVEAKDVGIPLDETENSEQLLRYRESLANLILTDYLEFRWYERGKLRLSAVLAKPQSNGKLRPETRGEQQLQTLLQGFFASDIPVISGPRELAERMAALARLIRSIIANTFTEEGEQGSLHEQLDGFRKVLMHDLDAGQFADMYAQTICYGLFAARCNHTGAGFNRANAAYDLPKTNPFLRQLFGHIAGPQLDERIVWAVDSLAELLKRADMPAILKDFGRATLQQDPVVHFYETFLRAYDRKMREARGVYYTPGPVVSYIVRSVDAILKTDFKLSAGLADAGKIKLSRPKLKGKGTETFEAHKVQILDPAVGTGTFLHQVIGHIRETLSGDKGLWTGYVRENLLPRLYGFELLMAPYAVAHMKLGLLLRETGYDFKSDERLRVYLTNTLEEAHEDTGYPLFTQWLAHEANSANEVKKEAPIMVVLGNPPYSGVSANVGKWIEGLLHGVDSSTGQATGNYFLVDGQLLNERKHWLNDDYVKFIRFAQWRIEQTGYGVLAFVTNHGYLDNPTFRGMRQSLLATFDDIYILDLHGNSKKKEKSPDGGKDENVFDIQQGVAIGLFVKKQAARSRPAQVYHAELYGPRAAKYAALAERDCASTKWKKLKPTSPFYFFVPRDESFREEYERGWKITDIMPLNTTGIVTARDHFVIDFDDAPIKRRISVFLDSSKGDREVKEELELSENYAWRVADARRQLAGAGNWQDKFTDILYRPFDKRRIIYDPSVVWRTRNSVMRHMLAGHNLALVTSRMTKGETFQHTQVTRNIVEVICMSPKTSNNGFVFPLYLYPDESSDLFAHADSAAAQGARRPNISPEFIKDFSARLKLDFVPDGKGDLKTTFGPEDIFHYAYAVFYSPGYRRRYAEFLKTDFPKLPLTSDGKLFRKLCAFGSELAALHLLETQPTPQTRYPVAGNDTVEKVIYTAPQGKVPGRVWLNATQYFGNVPPEVWNYQIGGYQVCQKWLKDRKSRKLSYEDLTHYRVITAALSRTIDLQAEIDKSIPKWPIQ